MKYLFILSVIICLASAYIEKGCTASECQPPYNGKYIYMDLKLNKAGYNVAEVNVGDNKMNLTIAAS